MIIALTKTANVNVPILEDMNAKDFNLTKSYHLCKTE